MKKVLVLVLGMAVIFSVCAVAQNMGQDPATTQTSANAPLKTIKGTVKMDGDKATFVADKDQKSWDVMNPETMKDHDGHHVQVNAHVYAATNAIHVMPVKMLSAAK